MTDEEALKAARAIWLNFYPFALGRDVAAWRAGIQAASELLFAKAPSTCTAPIHGMTVEQFKAACCEELVYKNAKLFSRVETVDAHDLFMVAADVAHRLAQPTPAVDSDKEEISLCVTFMRATSNAYKGISARQIWDRISERERNAWRVVAAAKAGKGE